MVKPMISETQGGADARDCVPRLVRGEVSLPTAAATIKCRCGHEEYWERFYEDGLGNPLPFNHHRCPSCHWQWTRIRNPKGYPPILIVDVGTPVL